MQVVHLQRKPLSQYYSMREFLPRSGEALPKSVQCAVHVSPYLSRGILPRAANLLAAARQPADIYHITGDVHYLALGLPPGTGRC